MKTYVTLPSVENGLRIRAHQSVGEFEVRVNLLEEDGSGIELTLDCRYSLLTLAERLLAEYERLSAEAMVGARVKLWRADGMTVMRDGTVLAAKYNRAHGVWLYVVDVDGEVYRDVSSGDITSLD